MRRSFCLALAAAAMLLLLGPATSLAAAGPCTVTGRILDVAGDPVGGTWVELSYEHAGVVSWFGATLTDAGGSFVFTEVPETTGGEIEAATHDDTRYRSSGHTFTAAGPNHVVLRPGLVDARLTLRNDPHWGPPLLVETWGSHGGGRTWIAGAHGSAVVLAPDCDYAVAYPYNNQGIEWSGPVIPVAPGVRAGAIAFDQADARGAWFSTPSWHSGKPGATTTVVLHNWPRGYRIGFHGSAIAPEGPVTTWPSITSQGRLSFPTAIKVPTTAPAGYAYGLRVTRAETGSRLELNLRFQVASLAPTHARVSPGGSLRLSGIVPTEGHWGSRAGRPKSVTLYCRTTSAAQPLQWDATRNGWTKAGVYRTNGFGEFRTGLLTPRRTTWYVVRYPGDGQYFRAFTSVTTVTVR